MSETHSHQGVIAVAAAQSYATVEDILEKATATHRPFFCRSFSSAGILGTRATGR